MKASELGEFELIKRLTSILPPTAQEDLIVGPSDDAAVWRVGERYVIATTDTLVEGVHFAPEVTPWADVGWKALAVNLSDLAAMGAAESLFGLITLAVPPEMSLAPLEELYFGLAECATVHRVAIVGGDVVRAPTFSVTLALVGKAHDRAGQPLVLRRDRAVPGDVIAVTGSLGDLAGGSRSLGEGVGADDSLVRAHLRPNPRMATGGIAARTGVECGTDVSDGLLQDVRHICEMSGVGAVLESGKVPMSAALRERYPAEALEMACTGGEDYEIVLVAPRNLMEQVVTMAPDPLTVIGEIREGASGVRVSDDSGVEIEFASAGWDHLRSR